MTLPIGLLLAAGRGRRMGQTKQLLPWPPPDGSKPLAAAAFDAISEFCDQMVVMVGHESEKVISALEPRSFQAVHSDADLPMYESIRTGLQAIQRIAPGRAVLIHPADHPEVSATTLQKLIQSSAVHPHNAVCPHHEGRGGHPVLVGASLVPGLIRWSGTGGLRQFWLDDPETLVELPVEDATIVRDLDTPDDYAAAWVSTENA